jgi:hypothetical protein
VGKSKVKEFVIFKLREISLTPLIPDTELSRGKQSFKASIKFSSSTMRALTPTVRACHASVDYTLQVEVISKYLEKQSVVKVPLFIPPEGYYQDGGGMDGTIDGDLPGYVDRRSDRVDSLNENMLPTYDGTEKDHLKALEAENKA